MIHPPRFVTYFAKLFLFAVLCYLVARVGLFFALDASGISLVWPLTGISMAVLLLVGLNLWPGLWLALVLINLVNQTPLPVTLGIAIGSTSMSVFGAYALKDRAHFRLSFHRVQDVLSFVGIGVILSPIISATVGTTCFFLAGIFQSQLYLREWFTWWVGDAMSVLVIMPVLLIWRTIPLRGINRRRLTEAVILIVLLEGVCGLIFSQRLAQAGFYPLAYLIFPFLVWGALRFDQRIVVTLTLIVALMMVVNTTHQLASFNTNMVWNSLLFLWAFMATMAITALLLTATLAERRLAEATVRRLEERFSKAFQLAPVAIWIMNVGVGSFVDANEEFCLLMGYSPHELVGKNSLDLRLWENPQTREQLAELLEQKGHVTQTEVRLRSKFGELRDGLLSLERLELEGQPRVLAMFQDNTARLQTESALRQSEAHYHELFEGVDDAIFVHDLEANILDVNEAAGRRMGYSRNELLKMKITDLDTPDFAAGFGARLQQQIEQGFLSQIEGVRIAKDGRKVLVDVNTKLISYNRQPAILAVDHDITERKLSEQKLRESEARYRAVVEDQSELICRFSPDFILTFVNDAYCRYFGLSREELLGTSFMPSIYENDQETVKTILRSLTAENPVMVSENQGYMPDGSLRWHQWRDHAITDEQGRIVEYQSVGKDVTDVKEIEKQRLAVALEHEKVQILADFIAAASHDFRTPLSVINTSAYLLNRLADSVQRDHHFKQIQDQTYNIERLVDGLLTMSRLDRGDVFRFKPISLNSIIRQIEIQKRTEIEQKLQPLRIELDPNLPLIHADEGWIYRAIIQLVENAFNYTPEHGVITIRTYSQPDRVVVAVSDTGSGISDEAMPHIFKRLYRGEEHRPVGGQGLGLSIAAKIVEEHRGSIEVETAQGKGSTFRILLPLIPADKNGAASPSP